MIHLSEIKSRKMFLNGREYVKYFARLTQIPDSDVSGSINVKGSLKLADEMTKSYNKNVLLQTQKHKG